MDPNRLLADINSLRTQELDHLKRAEEHRQAAGEARGAIKAYEHLLKEYALEEQAKAAAEANIRNERRDTEEKAAYEKQYAEGMEHGDVIAEGPKDE